MFCSLSTVSLTNTMASKRFTLVNKGGDKETQKLLNHGFDVELDLWKVNGHGCCDKKYFFLLESNISRMHGGIFVKFDINIYLDSKICKSKIPLTLHIVRLF